MVNIFGSIKLDKCDDCSNCAMHLAEMIYLELKELKRNSLASEAANEKTPDKEKAAAKDSTEKAKDSTRTEKAAVSQADTFNYSTSYEDSNYYKLTLIRFKEGALIKMCPKELTGCEEQLVSILDKETFKRVVTAMLKKLLKQDAIDDSKITPPLEDTYSKYEKEYAAKHPKEKPLSQTLALAAAAELAKDSLTKINVGRILLRDSMVDVFSYSGKLLKRVKIDSVTFRIEDGRIAQRSLNVWTSTGTYWNRIEGIPVRRINFRSRDRLDNMDIPDSNFVRMRNILRFDNGGYVPDDAEDLVLKPLGKPVMLSAANNLNSMINFSLYTDLAGLVGRKPNGLLNTDVTGKFITNTNNIWSWSLTVFNFIEAHIVLSKFDSKFKSIDSTSISLGKNGQLDTIDRMKLMQTAWLKGSMKFNALSYHTSSNQNIELNIGARINIVNADSLFGKEQTRDLIFFEYFPELVYSVNRVKNFGMQLSCKWLFQRVADQEKFSNLDFKTIFNPQIGFYYYPAASPLKQFYLKFNYFAGHEKEAKNFYQLQFGWRTGFKL